MIRAYLSQFTGGGAGFPTAITAVLRQLVPTAEIVAFCDGRANPQLAAGWALVLVDVSAAQHATLIADARIQYLPIEDAAGTPLSADDTISMIPAAKRATLQALCDQHHVPIVGFNGATLIRHLWRRWKRRFLLRQILGPDDLTEPWDSTVGQMTVARRQAIRTRTEAAGLVFVGVELADTLAQACAKLIDQPARVMAVTE